MAFRTIRRGLAAAGLAVALTTGLAACSWPDVSMSPGVDTGSAAATTSASPTSAAPRSAAPATARTHEAAATARTPGELDAGSVTHAVPAGDATVVIDYWTTQDATSWTAADDKTIQLSAHLEGGTGAATKVTRFVVTADDGTTRSTVTEDRGEFMITPPFSYGTVLSLAPAAADATALTLYVQFDLLVETERHSGTWFRQTVLDTLQLPLEEIKS
jgi:hypothetical protein